MKITIVQGAFLPMPPLRGGAVEKVWQGIGQELAARGHQVTHISRRFPGLPDAEKVDGIQHLRVGGHEAPGSLALLKLLDLNYSLKVRRILPEADILVTNTFWLPILVRTRKHGALYVHVARYPRGQFKYYRHAARLQTVSPFLAEAIRERVPECSARIKMITNPLLDNIRLGKDEFDLVPRKPEFLFVGRVHPEKGIDNLLKAYTRYAEGNPSPWKLTVVGPWERHLGGGGDDYFAKVKAQVPDSLKDLVHWAGFTSEPSELRRRLIEAGVFLYPTVAAKGEASPVAPLEAMGCGCPVLVSNLDCFQGLIEEGKTGFVFNHEVSDPSETLAARMKELSLNQTLRDEVARRGWEHAGTLSLSRITDEYEADFKKVLLESSSS